MNGISNGVVTKPMQIKNGQAIIQNLTNVPTIMHDNSGFSGLKVMNNTNSEPGEHSNSGNNVKYQSAPRKNRTLVKKNGFNSGSIQMNGGGAKTQSELGFSNMYLHQNRIINYGSGNNS